MKKENYRGNREIERKKKKQDANNSSCKLKGN